MVRKYVVCVDNDGYPASLELRKIYEVVDVAGEQEPGLIRIVDESGDDYLFPTDFFVSIELPVEAEVAFSQDR